MHLTGHAQVPKIFKWLWNSSYHNKHKVIFWLLLKDRLNTRNFLRRKTMVLDSCECELCNSGVEETLEHLFLECPFASTCWNLITIHILSQVTVLEAIDSFNEQLHSPISLDIIILLCWAIWTSRNGVIFQNHPASISLARSTFKKEVTLILHRVKPKHKECLVEWINNFG